MVFGPVNASSFFIQSHESVIIFDIKVCNDTVYIYQASYDKFEQKSKISLLGLKNVCSCRNTHVSKQHDKNVVYTHLIYIYISFPNVLFSFLKNVMLQRYCCILKTTRPCFCYKTSLTLCGILTIREKKKTLHQIPVNILKNLCKNFILNSKAEIGYFTVYIQ